MNDLSEVSHQPRRLVGSLDSETGQVFFPPRALAVDGSLRPCEPVELSRTGVLYTWTRFAGQCFGQIDLPEGVRLQTPLDGDNHDIGASYSLVIHAEQGGQSQWSFAHD